MFFVLFTGYKREERVSNFVQESCDKINLNRFRFIDTDSIQQCRAGAGQTFLKGSTLTEGFKVRKLASLEKCDRGSLRLHMPRNSRRMVQTSKRLLQGWRGNCDLQVLLYQSGSTTPDPREIAAVTDYIVGYACKGSNTAYEERNLFKSFISE